jgi:type I restriction enzyme S subunit
MASNWRTYIVSELEKAELLRVEDGNHGEYRPRQDEFVETGTPFIRAADMDRGRIFFESASRINETALSRIRKGIGCPGDTLLSSKGTVGKVALAPLDCESFVCSPQVTFWRSLDNNFLDYRFLYYYIQSAEFWLQVAARSGETDMAPYISLTNQREFKITMPELEEQKAIAHILGTLDDKIELNQQMNRTLEAIAQAIFKSWFVDFDPVRAKMDGRQPAGLDAATADLFPDSFEDSPLGKIPKGWKFSTLNEVSKIVDSLHQTPSYSEQGYPMVRVTDIKGGYLDLSNCKRVTETVFEEFTKKYIPQKEDIVLSRVGTYGISSYVGSDEKFCLGQNTVVIHPKIPSMYLYLSLQTPDVKDQIEMAVVGSTQKTISLQNIKAITIIVSNQSVFTRFSELVNPLFTRINENILQSNTLATIRDTLLPKLLSGEIMVKEAEKLMEAVA